LEAVFGVATKAGGAGATAAWKPRVEVSGCGGDRKPKPVGVRVNARVGLAMSSISSFRFRLRWPFKSRFLARLKIALLRGFAQRARDNSITLIALAVAIGLVVGAATCLLQHLLALIHWLLFATPLIGHLSAGDADGPIRIAAVTILGCFLYGLVAAAERRWRGRDVVDPIEANALYGGRMSLRDSLSLTAMTLFSTGVGASVGMEAAYTQSGGGFASQLGQLFRMRRGDLRILVGCGTAAAIAAAFNAPLAGAFYAFELVIGSYSLAALAPVGLASVSAALVGRSVFGTYSIFLVPQQLAPTNIDFFYFVVIGFAGAGVGIAAMRAVTGVERVLQRVQMARGLRPLVAGLGLAAMALLYPQVLGAGHGAIQLTVDGVFTVGTLAGILLAKIAASALSVGPGMRGGMFSSSLFLGCLLGALIGKGAALLSPSVANFEITFTLAGMGAVGAAIIGAPVTMILLVLETTGNYDITIGVIVSVVLASFASRQWFGYSFSTWRFHQRGLRLRGAFDVGWLSDITARQLMRRDPVFVSVNETLETARQTFPVGSVKRLFVLEETGGFRGVLDTAALHLVTAPAEATAKRVGDLLPEPQEPILPGTPIRTILNQFEQQEVETLAVVGDMTARRVLGFVTEAFVLKRYNRELERRRSEELGDSELFGSSTET
jgi:CIC family chloride channel protein